MSETVLKIDGLVRFPASFSFADLAALPSDVQVRDISRFTPKRHGDGVLLSALLAQVEPSLDNYWLTFHAALDDFAASIPSDPKVLETGIVVYAHNGQPLSTVRGGPVRFLIPDPAVCHTAELDDCANVKFLDRIEITAERGRDTRPEDEAEHEELHRREQSH